MLLDIYRSMFAYAAGWTISNMEVGFTFNEEETKDFWSKDSKDHAILIGEWNCVDGIGRYEKTLYGKKFFIQFTF